MASQRRGSTPPPPPPPAKKYRLFERDAPTSALISLFPWGAPPFPPSLLPFVPFVSSLRPARIVKDGLEDAPASKLYVTSVYWTVTTLSTVGYGDIFASTIAERTYCILVSSLVAALVFQGTAVEPPAGIRW